jgi:catechol 2,3-dioxygenase-like lactoylglutathione lyase family enzyme
VPGRREGRHSVRGKRGLKPSRWSERRNQVRAGISRMKKGIAKKTCNILPMISGFHSVVIDLRDFDVGVRDYSRLLGQRPMRIETLEGHQTQSAFFRLANMALELRAVHRGGQEGGARDAGAETSGGPFGLNGIRLASDAEPLAEVMTDRGLRVASSRKQQARSGAASSVRTWRTDSLDLGVSRGLPVEIVSEESAEAAPFAEGPETSEEACRILGDGWREVEPSARIRSLDHVVVMSPDPEATRAFYGEGLGLRLALDKSFEKRGVRLIFFRIGGTTIEIGGRLGVEARPDRSDRFGGLAWQIVDLEATQSRLAGDGFDVSEIRDGNKQGTRVCTVRDPVHDVPTLLIEPVS